MNYNRQASGSPRILVVAPEAEKAKELSMALSRFGFACIPGESAVDWYVALTRPNVDLAVVDVDGSLPSDLAEAAWQQLRVVKAERALPIIAIVSKNMLQKVSFAGGMDDFVVEPWDVSELIARIRRVIALTNQGAQNDELVNCGDLKIDLARCEVYLCGKPLDLTFKEYELVKFLAQNRGRVFSRDALLNEVWGYDYYGGDRTVDVHIRRLRSKIEDSSHTFIETIRNIGYRFKGEN
jgi:DNA-binding response OmpR family regulator